MKTAKRANRPNPREDRNPHQLDDNVFDFPSRRNRNNRDQTATRPPVEEETPKPTRLALIPKNLSQETYLAALNDPYQHIVVGSGPAGCGKTYLAVLWAIQQLELGHVDRIVITKPFVPIAGESSLGALPGGILEKLENAFSSLLDPFKLYYGKKRLIAMIEAETIVMQPLATIRGRSFSKAIILIDEAQNTTPESCLACISRIGFGSKVVLAGDTRQHDKGFAHNGLKDLIERIETHRPQGLIVCHFNRADIERHPVIANILKIYGHEDT